MNKIGISRNNEQNLSSPSVSMNSAYSWLIKLKFSLKAMKHLLIKPIYNSTRLTLWIKQKGSHNVSPAIDLYLPVYRHMSGCRLSRWHLSGCPDILVWVDICLGVWVQAEICPGTEGPAKEFTLCLFYFSASKGSRNYILDIFQQSIPSRFWRYPFCFYLVRSWPRYCHNW